MVLNFLGFQITAGEVPSLVVSAAFPGMTVPLPVVQESGSSPAADIVMADETIADDDDKDEEEIDEDGLDRSGR